MSADDPPRNLKRSAPAQQETAATSASTSSSSRCSEQEFECVVCADVLLDPVVAPACGHDFCSQCYQGWVRSCGVAGTPAACPLCRAGPLPPSLAVCLRLKNVVERQFPKAVQRRRRGQAAESAQSQLSSPSASDDSTLPHPGLLFSSTAVDTASPAPGWPVASQPAMAAAIASAMQSPSWLGAVYQSYASTLQMMALQLYQQAPVTPVPAPTPSTLQPITADASCGPPSAWASCMLLSDPATACLPAAGASNPPHAAAAPPARQPWHSATDGERRMAVARNIIRVLLSRGLHASLGDKLPEAVRYLELVLYRSASTLAEYINPVDLEARVVAAVHQRITAARARRERLAAAAAVSSAAAGAVTLAAPAHGGAAASPAARVPPVMPA